MPRVGPPRKRELAGAHDALVVSRNEQEATAGLQLAPKREPVHPRLLEAERRQESHPYAADDRLDEQTRKRRNCVVELGRRDRSYDERLLRDVHHPTTRTWRSKPD